MKKIILFVILSGVSFGVHAASLNMPGVNVTFSNGASGPQDVASAIEILLALTVLSLAPAILMMMTSFTRIIIVLAMLRHALGMQQTPPNTVLISLALFLTLFQMMPIVNQIKNDAFQPYLKKSISAEQAMDKALDPMRNFMVKQTREKDLALMIELSGGKKPNSVDEVSTVSLIPAFMISELKSAFQLGFIIFLPFLLIDIVVASILMSMGMLMVPPMMISLPIKILMFVLIDGWALVIKSLMGSFT